MQHQVQSAGSVACAGMRDWGFRHFEGPGNRRDTPPLTRFQLNLRTGVDTGGGPTTVCPSTCYDGGYCDEVLDLLAAPIDVERLRSLVFSLTGSVWPSAMRRQREEETWESDLCDRSQSDSVYCHTL